MPYVALRIVRFSNITSCRPDGADHALAALAVEDRLAVAGAEDGDRPLGRAGPRLERAGVDARVQPQRVAGLGLAQRLASWPGRTSIVRPPTGSCGSDQVFIRTVRCGIAPVGIVQRRASPRTRCLRRGRRSSRQTSSGRPAAGSARGWPALDAEQVRALRPRHCCRDALAICDRHLGVAVVVARDDPTHAQALQRGQFLDQLDRLGIIARKHHGRPNDRRKKRQQPSERAPLARLRERGRG